MELTKIKKLLESKFKSDKSVALELLVGEIKNSHFSLNANFKYIDIQVRETCIYVKLPVANGNRTNLCLDIYKEMENNFPRIYIDWSRTFNSYNKGDRWLVLSFDNYFHI